MHFLPYVMHVIGILEDVSDQSKSLKVISYQLGDGGQSILSAR